MSTSHSLDVYDKIRTPDNLFDYYHQQREKLISLMTDNPDLLVVTIWKNNSPLLLDEYCDSCLQENKLNRKRACGGCLLLRRIINLQKIGLNSPFSIPNGRLAGKRMIITTEPVLSHFLRINQAATNKGNSFRQLCPLVQRCGGSRESLRCLEGDTFTICALVTFLAQQLLSSKNMPHFLKLYTTFICNEEGYFLHDYPDLHDLSHLLSTSLFAKNSTEIVASIFFQLLATFSELATINFSLGTASRTSFLFTSDPVSYRYENVLVQGPCTLKLANMWYSSLSWGGQHYFTNGEDLCPSYSSSIEKEGNTYLLTPARNNFYQELRRLGVPLYTGSYDFYSCLVSFLEEPLFFDSFMSNSKLVSLWSAMWNSFDLGTINERLKMVHEKKKPSASIFGLQLRCDVLTVLREMCN